MPNKLSKEEFLMVLPAKMRKNVDDTLINSINTTITDPEVAEAFRDNLLGFANVIKEGRFKMEQYLSAVMYCSYKLMGDSNKNAYIKTFPGKYSRFLKENVSEKDIASYSTAYNKTKLVNLIMEQAMVPTHILNAPLYQAALNTQAEIMTTAKSEMARTAAASSLITALKPPETKKIELDVGIKEDESLAALRASTMELVRQQRAMLTDGSASAKSVAESRLVDVATEIQGEIIP